MLKKSTSLSCSFGLFGLLVHLVCLVHRVGLFNKLNETNRITVVF